MISSIFNNKKTKRELFKSIYEENFQCIYAFVFSRLAGNKEATEDIVQETFFAAMKSLEGFQNKSSYKTWLCGIAKHKITNYYQRELVKSEFIYLDEVIQSNDDYSVDANLINTEKRKIVFEILNRLNPIYRYALILKYIDGYSVKEIANMLNRTNRSIEGILQRARTEFKKSYSEYVGDDSYEPYRSTN